ncbi:MAG: hypothetical protein ACFFCS_20060 [Candidatus Hodarchaeota archaeon]
MFVIMTAKIPYTNAKKLLMSNMAAGQKNALEPPPGEQIVVGGKTRLDGASGIVVHTATKETVGEIVHFYYKWMGQLQDVEGLEFAIDVYENANGLLEMLGIEVPS